jgi:acetoin utilization deacetylase AcuC-like enzyme
MTSIVYSDRYYCDIGPHVFPTEKYYLLYQKLKENGKLASDNVEVIEPRPATRDELALVHDDAYLDDALNARSTSATIRSELPVEEDVIDAFLLSTGGTIMASEYAANGGRGINLGGGYHHAFADHAEGFCYFNDVAIAARKLQSEGKAARVAIVDCDLHQGNGTAHIFRQNPSVFTFSIHQEHNYPIKQQSDLDIGLDDGVGDEEYLERLGAALEPILYDFKPDYAFYLAGADPFVEDQLGALRLTHDGFRRRDDLVIGGFRGNAIPLCVVLAGGYSRDVSDTVDIHYETCVRLIEEA